MSKELEMQSLKTIARGAGIIFAGMIIGQFLGYLTRVVIARWLGPSEYGLITLALAVFGIATAISLFGFENAITRYIAYYMGKKDDSGVKGSIVTSLKVCVPISLAFSIVIFLFSSEISNHFFHSPELTPILSIFSLMIPVNVIGIILISSIRGFQKPEYKFYISDIFYPTLKIVLAAYLVWIGLGIFGAAIAWAASLVAGTAVAAYFFERRVFPVLRTRVRSKKMTREMVSFSFPLMLGSVMLLILGWTDIIFLGFLKTSMDVGIYNAALPTAGILGVVIGGFIFLFMPVISELLSKDKINEIKSVFSTVTRWMFIVIFPAFILMILFPGTILNILFGPEYLEGSLTLSILAVAYFSSYLFGPCGQVLLSLGKTRIIMVESLIAAVLNIILNILLIPEYGMVGAAVALVISFVAGHIFHFTFVYYFLRAHPYSMNFIKPLFSGSISGVFIYTLAKFIIIDISILSAILLGILFLLIYSSLILVLRSFGREDIEMLKAIEKKTGVRIEFLRNLIKRFA